MMRALSLLDGMKEKVKTKPASLFDSVKKFNRKDRVKMREEDETSSRKVGPKGKGRGFLKAIGAA